MKTRRVVYVSLDIFPGAPARTATEVRARQNLLALRELGYETTVITMPDERKRPLDFPVKTIAAKAIAPFVPFNLDVLYRRKISREIARLAAEPGAIIFCEHWAAMLCAPHHPRVIYSFHDFEAALIRSRRLHRNLPVHLRTRLYFNLATWFESRMIRRASRVISVSASEAEQLRAGWGAVSEYIPIVSPAPVIQPDNYKAGSVRLWFYGGRGSTSNMIMLQHLRDKLYNLLKAELPQAEFHHAGVYETYDPPRLEWLKQNFILHGFVPDFATVFRAGDINLIPYEQDTGFRTKIPEACSYGMISAGYPISFACCPEMRDGYNCIMASSPEELARKLAQVAADDEWRRRLANGARETFERDFSAANLLERYRRVLDFS